MLSILTGKLESRDGKLSLRCCGFGLYRGNSRREENILLRPSFLESHGGWVEEHQARKRQLYKLGSSGFPLILAGIFLLVLHYSAISVPAIYGLSPGVSFDSALSAFSDPSVTTLGGILVAIGLGLSFSAALAVARISDLDRQISHVADRLPVAEGTDAERLCVYCNTPLTMPGSRFCPGCGARLITLDEGNAVLASIGEAAVTGATTVVSVEQAAIIAKALRVRRRERAGTCMVCKLDLKSSDPLAWCPHCGNPAHRDHLIEWVRVRRKCPMCGEHLVEAELTEQLSRSDRQRRGSGGTGKPTSLQR
jgi:Zn finger protein HypA/HybF involved in hydrogenase expression